MGNGKESDGKIRVAKGSRTAAAALAEAGITPEVIARTKAVTDALLKDGVSAHDNYIAGELARDPDLSVQRVIAAMRKAEEDKT